MSNSLRAAAEAPSATSAAPAGGRRIPLLDVLRGAAILGTLMTNVWIFAGTGSEWAVLDGLSTEGAGIPETVFRFLADGKFLSLLTILFGVGLAIQYDSAGRRGLPWPGSYRRRAFFLFAEGTLHFLLVFAWDVLMGYAVTALLVAWLLARSEKVQRRAMWIAGGLHVTLMSLVTVALAAGDSGGPAAPPSTTAVELYAHGSWFDQIRFRAENAIALRIEPVFSFGLLVFLFLLGVRLYRAGAFGPDARGRRIRARLAGWGLGLGMPLGAAAIVGGDAYFALGRYVIAPVVALGYIGLIGVVMDRVRTPGPVTVALSSVGRTALSCYVLQNLLCMLACYGIGLGLAERFAGDGPYWVMGLWAVVCVILTASSWLWLKRHPIGPLESVQKRLIGR
ncbi:DUF418 domain-containing protein [Streptomyces bambusae]|uniref:DUF418 domain-containing protein n=1 Tax=Streptomyces bambusae TaxID=1550616 RepID=UPI001CFC5FAC|nr:DUF418 domain-containing protein [Streptomyces bambusae]MCB5163410.1 DUF418 domain-containing protein [Streptomyces bambusae]